MASSSGRSFALLFSILTLLILITTFLTPACSLGLGEPNNNPKLEVNANDNGAPKKVPLALYYEALCPGCSDFIVNGLAPMFLNGLIDIVDLELVPWGNAELTPDKKFECQHGPEECLLNTIEACAINVWPSLSKNFPFIYCVEELSNEGKQAKWEACFQKSGLDGKPVKACYSSGYGKQLELKYANMTDRLRPPHEFVPWVIVDGQPLKEDFGNFTSYVCKAYKGPLPPACNNLSFDNNVPRQKTDRAYPVCYNEETTTKMGFDVNATD